jgi:2-keto-4-pentenoate hydratase
LSPHELDVAAEALWTAERQAAPIAPLVLTWPGMDAADAYQVQRRNVLRRKRDGCLVRGYKVGLSSKAMQEMLGVSEPDYGHLTSDMFVGERASVEMAQLCRPRVEVEVAFVLGRTLRAPGATVADVLAATDYLLPAIEVIDSRIADWNITLVDTIADNASSARVALGARATRASDVDLRSLGASLAINGQTVATGTTSAVLGDPAVAVAWLADKLATLGVVLQAGQVVLSGSCTRAFDVGRGDRVEAEIDLLGQVAVSFA